MKVAILTSGGDAPGMNALLVNLTQLLFRSFHEVFLVKNGFAGLITNTFLKINYYDINDDYLILPGSFINCSRSKEFLINYQLAINNLLNKKIGCVIIIGGNGTYQGAKLIASHIPTIFIPATIDNDVSFSKYAIGFSSACQEVVSQSLKIKATFKTHQNIVFIEVMGRYANDLLLSASQALLPALTITNEQKLNKNEIFTRIKDFYKFNNYAVILVVENLYNSNEIDEINQFLSNQFNCSVRYNVLGYSQRGAPVNYYDLIMANKMAKIAVDLINNNSLNQAIFFDGCKLISKSYNLINEEIINN